MPLEEFFSNDESDVFLSSLVFGVWFSCHSCTDRLVLEMGGLSCHCYAFGPFFIPRFIPRRSVFENQSQIECCFFNTRWN